LKRIRVSDMQINNCNFADQRYNTFWTHLVSIICNKNVTTQNLAFWVIGIERNICRCTFNRLWCHNAVCKTHRWRAVVLLLHSQKIIALHNLYKFLLKNYKFWVVTLVANERCDIVGSSDPLFWHSEWHIETVQNAVFSCDELWEENLILFQEY
jgi:hypothetical protein